MANQYLQPFFDQLSQGTQVASQLRAAAQQQAQFESEKQQRESEMKLREKDLQMREQQNQHGNERQDLLDKLNVLQSGGQPVNSQGGIDQQTQLPTSGAPGSQPGGTETTSVPADPGRTVTTGGQGFQIPTLDEQGKSELARRVQQASAMDSEKLGTYGVGLPDALSKSFGVAPGTKFLPDHAAGLAKLHEAMNPKPDEKKDPKYTLTTDDHGNQSYVGLLDGKPNVIPIPGAKGKSRESMNIHVGGGAAKPASKSLLAGIESKKSAALAKAEVQFRKEMEKSKAGGYTDPDAAQNAVESLTNAKQQAQDGYENELRAAGAEPSHVEYGAPPQKAAAPPAQAQAKPPSPGMAQAATVPKLAPMDKVQAYATQKGIKLGQAVQEFKQSGFTVK